MLGMLGVAAALAGVGGEDPRGKGVEGIDFVTLRGAAVECTIGNNRSSGAHGAGYNGLFRLAASGGPPNAFVPAYAGLNLEHYFDATPRSADAAVFMEPRYAPMELTRISDRAVELHQPTTPLYRVESWTRFEVRDPHSIDVTFRCRPHRSDYAGGFLGMFWASYMNAPLDKSIYFTAPGSTLEHPAWLQFCTQRHDHYSTVRREGDAVDLAFGAVPTTLYNQLSPLRYGLPFYYGRIGDMVLINIFGEGPCVRFAHSPSGGGRTGDQTDTNPAWDFELIIANPQAGQDVTLRWRTVYKRWLSREDVLDQVRRYLEEPPRP